MDSTANSNCVTGRPNRHIYSFFASKSTRLQTDDASASLRGVASLRKLAQIGGSSYLATIPPKDTKSNRLSELLPLVAKFINHETICGALKLRKARGYN